MTDLDKPAPKPLVTGVASALSPMVRRMVAPNPGVMTGPGTNTYLVGIDEIAVIDPGVDDESHLDAIVGCGGDRIRWILCTHTHPDHSPGAARLKERTGAEVLAFDVARRPRASTPRSGRASASRPPSSGCGRCTRPGHASNHLCYLLEEERLLFSGDHIMQGSTVVIARPTATWRRTSSRSKVRSMRLRFIAPGHGHLIDDPQARSSTTTSSIASTASSRSSRRCTRATEPRTRSSQALPGPHRRVGAPREADGPRAPSEACDRGQGDDARRRRRGW